MSQTVITVHRTFVQLPFEHRSKAIGRRCQGAPEPLKSAAHLDSSTVSIGWVWSSIGGSSSEVVEACPSTSDLNGKGIEQNQRLREHPSMCSLGVN